MEWAKNDPYQAEGGESPGVPPAQTTSVRGDVDAAVGQVGGDGHKLVDETGPAHQPEGAD